jgi:hypothetical protein
VYILTVPSLASAIYVAHVPNYHVAARPVYFAEMGGGGRAPPYPPGRHRVANARKEPHMPPTVQRTDLQRANASF